MWLQKNSSIIKIPALEKQSFVKEGHIKAFVAGWRKTIQKSDESKNHVRYEKYLEGNHFHDLIWFFGSSLFWIVFLNPATKALMLPSFTKDCFSDTFLFAVYNIYLYA